MQGERVRIVSPFANTEKVSFELSNICPYQHHQCPLSERSATKEILPHATITGVLRDLSDYGFSGRIGWNIYNEPLCDQRLFTLILEANALLGQACTIFVTTSGFYLDQVMIDELESIGVDWLRVSCYSHAEMERMRAIRPSAGMRFDPFEARLDDRMCFYDLPENDFRDPCKAPLGDISIYSDGKVAICCFDYERRHVFGDLNSESLFEIISRGEMHRVHDDLMHGRRQYSLCKRCGMSR